MSHWEGRLSDAAERIATAVEYLGFIQFHHLMFKIGLELTNGRDLANSMSEKIEPPPFLQRVYAEAMAARADAARADYDKSRGEDPS